MAGKKVTKTPNGENELLRIPGVGRTIAGYFQEMGYTDIASLKGQDPMAMYGNFCGIRGCPIDRCFLYVCRCAVYYAENEAYDPEKLKWWNWKD
jgi:hypothetical protein